jgi:hypothetical protein
MFVFDRFVTRSALDLRQAVGPFSSHWAAVAALIRVTEPMFRSIGGDRPEDLALEVSL